MWVFFQSEEGFCLKINLKFFGTDTELCMDLTCTARFSVGVK